jgi:CBS domain-containing protein
MAGILERLRMLLVQDIMSAGTIEVSQDESLVVAAMTMLERPVAGMPVVDDDGRWVGMLTAFDFVRCYAAQREGPPAAVVNDEFPPLETDAAGSPRTAASGGQTVAQQMTATVHAVPRDASLLEAARKMCDEHIHRLPVLDSRGHVEGIITSLDIVAAVTNAADEQTASQPPQRRRGKR